ncbi:MAG: DUF938 domain-containing protein [Pseudomonadota bacterium]
MQNRPFSPAAERNREPILRVLKQVLPVKGDALEIGSGTAQHVRLFARELLRWRWQPSELARNMNELQLGLSSRGDGPANIESPIVLDVKADWPDHMYDAIYSANTAHIMSWAEVQAMFAGVTRHLSSYGLFILYGPFKFDDRQYAQSNARFDLSLRQRDPAMGIRNVDELDGLADAVGLMRTAELAMPANNHILLFQKKRHKES